MIKNRTIRYSTASAALERDLRRMVMNNELSYDCSISTEAELAESYGIGRNSVRKALKVLEMEGLLKKVHGRGTFIVPPEKRPVINNHLKIMFVIADYNNLQPDNAYDRNFIAGGLEQAHISQSELLFMDPEGVDLDNLLKMYRNGAIQGIVWERPPDKAHPIIEALRNIPIPQVTCSRVVPGIPSISFDVERSIKETMSFLFGIGHRRIAFVDTNCSHASIRMRQRIFVSELEKSGINDPERYLCLFENMVDPMNEVYDSMPDVTALIIPHYIFDDLAIWVAERGIIIPEDLSIITISSENSRELDASYAVSAIIEPRRESAIKAVSIIERLNRCEKVSILPVKIPGKLFVSNTCISPKPGGSKFSAKAFNADITRNPTWHNKQQELPTLSK